MEEKRLKYLDYARGFSMLLVMYAHFFTVKEAPLRLWIYSFHMPIFFIITGILIYKKNSKLNIKKQIKHLIIPYFIFGILMIGCLGFIDIIDGKEWIPNVISNLKKTVLLYGVRAEWYLPCLFFAILIFYTIKDIFKEKKKIIAILIPLFLLPFLKVDITSIYTYKILLRSLIATIFLFTGYYLSEYLEKKNIKFYQIILLFFGTLICTEILGYVDLCYLKIPDPFIYYLSAIIGSLFILFFFKYIEKKQIHLKFLEFVGKNSLLILGTHMLIGYLVKKFLSIILETPYVVENLYLNGLIILIIVILIEIPIIFIVNKVKNIVIGKEYKK